MGPVFIYIILVSQNCERSFWSLKNNVSQKIKLDFQDKLCPRFFWDQIEIFGKMYYFEMDH